MKCMCNPFGVPVSECGSKEPLVAGRWIDEVAGSTGRRWCHQLRRTRDSRPKRIVIRLVERLTGRGRIVVYETARHRLRAGDDIFALAVQCLNIEVRYSAERLAAVPASGPLVVVANHPFGVIDGLVLCHLVAMVRPTSRWWR